MVQADALARPEPLVSSPQWTNAPVLNEAEGSVCAVEVRFSIERFSLDESLLRRHVVLASASERTKRRTELTGCQRIERPQTAGQFVAG